ncbi:hypothetical protein WKR88_15210 [Trinickia caryophylli]|uniref:Type III secretion protein (HrpB7) n=1 Tax=Trinickia caryophylli TaxID=28094 RepID=A0A1X7D6Y1_TRICW|nr:hypothetical protein [Trinickia caryophylli]PMS12692.1 hypothetical protein C0Z17_07605 [Trinickia caryophylli]TRX15098.1 hypothetical protein FNF07_28280 [Trinickia caryophylli]WQE14956.1 hypothetical protein U0034_20605 [Trinickia caryophylli]SMF09505.1 type III secretion protein (HrpB7) [Trinickia caryophylli]GLU31314.1 hypothetical protein Busp01_11560 [Trinickia caryophylli]
MSRSPQQVWKTVVAAKERAKERLEQELSDARRHYEALLGALDEAQAGVRHADAQRLEHEERIAALLSDARGLSPASYLNHDLYRAPLAQALEAARAAQRQAADAAEAQRRAVERLGFLVRRADAALEAVREQLRSVLATAQRRSDERTDEEAGEAAAARIRREG